MLQQSEALIRQYFDRDRRTLLADLDVLCDLGLLEKVEGRYRPAIARLSGHFANRVRRSGAGP